MALGACTTTRETGLSAPRALDIPEARVKSTVVIDGRRQTPKRGSVFTMKARGGPLAPSPSETTVVNLQLEDGSFMVLGVPDLDRPGAYPGRVTGDDDVALPVLHYYANGRIFSSTEECELEVSAVRPRLEGRMGSCPMTLTRIEADRAVPEDPEQLVVSLQIEATQSAPRFGTDAEPRAGQTRRNDALCAYAVYAGWVAGQLLNEINHLLASWWNPFAVYLAYVKTLEFNFWASEAVKYHPYCW